jgi:hypothetical protein
MFPGIIGAVKAALLGLDDRINAVRICTGNGDTDLSEDSFGKSIPLETFPGHAIIFRSIEPTPWPAA